MQRVRLSIFLLAITLAVACGGDAGSGEQPSTNAAAQSTTTAAPTTTVDDSAQVSAALEAALLPSAALDGFAARGPMSSERFALFDCGYATLEADRWFRDMRSMSWQSDDRVGLYHSVMVFRDYAAADAVAEFGTRSLACDSHTEQGGLVWEHQGDIPVTVPAGLDGAHAHCWADTAGSEAGRCYVLLSRGAYLSKVTITAPRLATARALSITFVQAAALALAAAPIPG